MIWLLFVFLATIFWALSDICNDACIELHSNPETEEKESESPPPSGGLSGEQSAFINIIVTFLFVLVGFAAGFAQIPSRDVVFELAVCGSLHFCAYFLLLKAFEDASSTEITPLLQTSAVWVFILQCFTNIFTLFLRDDQVEFIRPLHFVAFLLIIVGGFLPIAHGNLREMLTISFWKSKVVLLCVTSELLVATYSVVLHQATYKVTDENNSLVSAHFFVGTRIFSVFLGTIIFSTIPSMRQNARKVFQEPTLLRAASIKAIGDGLSIAGLVVGAVPYGSFYEPSIINAAEGGLQQMCNLVLAVLLYRCGFGRRVLFLRTKLISAVIVSFGLLLSSTDGSLMFLLPA